MFRDEKLELKVGIFIGVGIALMFLIVFAVKDVPVWGKTFILNVMFDYVNGIKENSPVRLAGVNVGEVKGIELFYDEGKKKNRVKINILVRDNLKIEKDSVARVNTLGLLGEQYLEISPGFLKDYFATGDTMEGVNPIHAGEEMEKMREAIASFSSIARNIEKGEGTIGKLIKDDTLYKNLENVFGGLSRGEGTLGKLLKDDNLYKDLHGVFSGMNSGEGTLGRFLKDDSVYRHMDEFILDLKSNPWKLLQKPRSSPKERESKTDKGNIVMSK
ncbi:Mammalian cell entry-like domain protein [Candidatus Omnitrophus magneticus]|uniref:Mammalian cell entry-like domain protein n=1 Tax=Candidatus Omnitrophus magneticus TaxID=1609969 RepID=A0A0F0CRR3_9BACT|nr:Mammalian cell entry-like domain protein [Candidatus Omnitrophus magneticus]